MIFLFLSVLSLCASAIVAFRMHLASLPAVTRADYDTLLADVHTLRGRLDKLNMGRT